MHAIIDIKTGSIVDASITLPFKKALPDGGVTIFKEAGQAEPSHAPRYKCVALKEAKAKPDYPVREVASEQVFDGKDVVVTKTYAPDQAAFERAIDAHVNAVAGERGYSSAVSLASYVASTVPLWKAEAEAFVAWRDAVWTYALAELEKVKAATRVVPTLDAFIAELPAMVWPEAQ